MNTGSFWRTQDVCHLRKIFLLQCQGERQQPPQLEDQFMQSSSSQLQLPSKLRLHKLKSMGSSACSEAADAERCLVENHGQFQRKKTRSQVGRTKDRKTMSQKERESEFCKICSKIGNIGASLFVTGIQWCCSVRQRFLVTFGRVEPNPQREMLCLKRENESPLCGLDLLLVSGRRMINLTLRGLSFRNVEVACILEEVLGKCACSYRFLSRLASCVCA